MHLTEELVRGRWQPGDTLSTYALAEELQISRTPILEALKRLESEGLVEIIPQVGCRVIRPSSESVSELFALRGALEGLAAEAVARRASEDELRQLGNLVEDVEIAARRGDPVAFVDRNHDLHLRIIELARQPRVAQSAESVWALLRYQVAGVMPTQEHMDASVAEHRAIFYAIQRHAAKKAKGLADEHAARSGERHLAELERRDEQAAAAPRARRRVKASA